MKSFNSQNNHFGDETQEQKILSNLITSPVSDKLGLDSNS